MGNVKLTLNPDINKFTRIKPIRYVMNITKCIGSPLWNEFAYEEVKKVLRKLIYRGGVWM